MRSGRSPGPGARSGIKPGDQLISIMAGCSDIFGLEPQLSATELVQSAYLWSAIVALDQRDPGAPERSLQHWCA